MEEKRRSKRVPANGINVHNIITITDVNSNTLYIIRPKSNNNISLTGIQLTAKEKLKITLFTSSLDQCQAKKINEKKKITYRIFYAA